MNQIAKLPSDVESASVPPPTSSPALANYERKLVEQAQRQLPIAAGRLKEAGVTRVLVRYDGGGDEGQIESIEYWDSEGKLVDMVGKLAAIDEQLMDLFYGLTQARHPGWDSGEGAYGEFVWNLADDTLMQTHSDRFIDYDTTGHEGL